MPPGLASLGELGAAVRIKRVSTLWLSAGLFREMVDTESASLRGLRQLLAGGDILSVPHVEKALRDLPDCRLINGYGPTEGTTFTCCYTVRRDEPLGTSVPIGRPIANSRVFILDRNRAPAPIGVPGELYIGGDGLARDYLRRPELTAERFIPSPFGEDGEERLYRTGDRSRYRADGTIEFLGASTTRSRSAAFAWSREKSSRLSFRTLPCGSCCRRAGASVRRPAAHRIPSPGSGGTEERPGAEGLPQAESAPTS